MRNYKYLALFVLAACGGTASTIPGTKVADTGPNRDIIRAVEEYRLAVERKDTAALMLMASEGYWEDRGTTTSGDDYGFDGLREVLTTRFQQAEDIRYSMRYMNIRRECPQGDENNDGCRAYVEVMVDASFSVTDARGEERRPDKRDQNEFVLEWKDDRWKFLSGM